MLSLLWIIGLARCATFSWTSPHRCAPLLLSAFACQVLPGHTWHWRQASARERRSGREVRKTMTMHLLN